MERTLVLFKPSCVQRGLLGEIISIFEKKGLKLVGLKMMSLDDRLLDEHYSHLMAKPFFRDIKASMMASPVIFSCWEGVGAVEVVRLMTGKTNGRNADAGTIRGRYCMSTLENIIHTSDSAENAQVELNRFFKADELFDYTNPLLPYYYAPDEL